jgi:hypothetical protein
VAAALGQALGGTVSGLRRLSGGASRITSSFDLTLDGGEVRPLILQQDRGGGMAPAGRVHTEAALLRAARGAGVPVPEVVALGDGGDGGGGGAAGGGGGAGGGAGGGLGSGWLVVDRIGGETIPRKILRDPEWAAARGALTAQCGQALAAIHTIDPDRIEGLAHRDPLREPLTFLDALGEVRPALELGARWLEANRPPAGRRVTVHGDFRSGNLLVGPDGLRAVLDWELAHGGDAAEDIGWLCAPAWRFGGPGPVGGFGTMEELLESYAAAGGETMEPERVKWWEVYATVKWATICALQASAHLSGATRSVELAAIGRRVCESEWDLFVLLGVLPADGEVDVSPVAIVTSPFGRPTALELVEAVREYLEHGVMEQSEGGEQFEARIARNALQAVERQLQLGPAIVGAHAKRLARLGFNDDATLASAIRSGTFDAEWREVGAELAASARDQLLVANPSYLPAANA